MNRAKDIAKLILILCAAAACVGILLVSMKVYPLIPTKAVTLQYLQAGISAVEPIADNVSRGTQSAADIADHVKATDLAIVDGALRNAQATSQNMATIADRANREHAAIEGAIPQLRDKVIATFQADRQSVVDYADKYEKSLGPERIEGISRALEITVGSAAAAAHSGQLSMAAEQKYWETYPLKVDGILTKADSTLSHVDSTAAHGEHVAAYYDDKLTHPASVIWNALKTGGGMVLHSFGW